MKTNRFDAAAAAIAIFNCSDAIPIRYAQAGMMRRQFCRPVAADAVVAVVRIGQCPLNLFQLAF